MFVAKYKKKTMAQSAPPLSVEAEKSAAAAAFHFWRSQLQDKSSDPEMLRDFIHDKNLHESSQSCCDGRTMLHMAVLELDADTTRMVALFFPDWLDVDFAGLGTPKKMAESLNDTVKEKKLILHYLQKPFTDDDRQCMLVWLEVLRHLYVVNFNGNKEPVTPGSCCCKIANNDRRKNQMGVSIPTLDQLPENMGDHTKEPNGYALYKPYTGYLGHNIVALAVDWDKQEVIDFAFNHNSVFKSPAEHAEMRLLDRIFLSRSHVSGGYLGEKQLKNVSGRTGNGQ